MMAVISSLAGLILVVLILWEVFEALVLPQRVTRRFRLIRLFYRTTWGTWSTIALRIPAGERREGYLSVFGPLSLLVLFGFWATGLVFGFALLQWASGSQLSDRAGSSSGFATDLYMSGTTFFTLGLGDVTPQHALARAITVVEAGTGFGLLAMVIAYMPIL